MKQGLKITVEDNNIIIEFDKEAYDNDIDTQLDEALAILKEL